MITTTRSSSIARFNHMAPRRFMLALSLKQSKMSPSSTHLSCSTSLRRLSAISHDKWMSGITKVRKGKKLDGFCTHRSALLLVRFDHALERSCRRLVSVLAVIGARLGKGTAGSGNPSFNMRKQPVWGWHYGWNFIGRSRSRRGCRARPSRGT